MQSIVTLRKSLGLSQHDLARLAGISRATVAQVETGRRNIPNILLVKLGELQRRLVAGEADGLPAGFAVALPEPEEFAAVREAQRLDEEKTLFKLRAERDKLITKLMRMETLHTAALRAMQIAARERLLFEGITSYIEPLEAAHAAALADWQRSHPLLQRPLRLRIAELDAGILLRESWLATQQTPESTDHPIPPAQ
jgi:transcriptional regulator with XRE-family HTH domain